MLRPATLLPAVRLSPHVGLSTPRFDGRPLDRRRGPATGLSGDYPGGTCTRWNDAARNDTVVRVHGWSNRFVRTHHGPINPAPTPWRRCGQWRRRWYLPGRVVGQRDAALGRWAAGGDSRARFGEAHAFDVSAGGDPVDDGGDAE
jgi:hypothetical protein